MSGSAFAILLAASFTFGCAAIHEWREYARDLTPCLSAALVCLTVLTGSVALVRTSNAADGAYVAGLPHRTLAKQ